MKLRKLEWILGTIEGVPSSPRIDLEQYPTPDDLAANLLFVARKDIQDAVVCDLGCGGGRLSIGALLLGADFVLGVDCCEKSVPLFVSNLEQLDVPKGHADILVADVCSEMLPIKDKAADVVIMNPPFGTRRVHADVLFLKEAMRIARKSVYSIHKTSTRKHIDRVVNKGCCFGRVVAQAKLRIPAMYEIHKKDALDIDVDVWKVEFEKGELD